MKTLPDLVTEQPDEFDVMAVTDGIWKYLGTYESRIEAMDEALRLLQRKEYKKVAIMPQISYMRPFQTHVMTEVQA